MINIKPRKPRAVLSSNDPNFEVNQYGVFDDTRLMIDDLGSFVDQVNQFGEDLALDLQATSTTSNTIGTGNKTFTVATNLGFAVGMILNVASSANVANRMRGAVVSYSKTTGQLVLSVEFIKGNGTFADWKFSLALDGGAGESNLLYAVTTGTGTAYEAAFAQPIAEYNDNQTFKIKFHTNCETNATLKLSGINPPLDIKIQNSAGLYVNVFKGDIVAGHVTLGLIINNGTAVLIESSADFIRDRSNKIIGGDFTTNPWQRGTSFAGVANLSYTADRWQYSHTSTAAITIAKVAESPSANQQESFSPQSLHINVTTADTTIAAGDFSFLMTKIEGLNSASFGFGQLGPRFVTLSFWVKSAKTGIHCVAIRNAANNRSYVAEYTIITANVFEKENIVIPVDTTGAWNYDNGIGMAVIFTHAVGSTFQTTAGAWQTGNFIGTANQVNVLDAVNNTFVINSVQLQSGSVPTEFQPRSVGQELVLCYRYAQPVRLTSRVIASAANQVHSTTVFYSPMRSAPSAILISAGTVLNISSANVVASSPTSARFDVTATAAGESYALDRDHLFVSEL